MVRGRGEFTPRGDEYGRCSRWQIQKSAGKIQKNKSRRDSANGTALRPESAKACGDLRDLQFCMAAFNSTRSLFAVSMDARHRGARKDRREFNVGRDVPLARKPVQSKAHGPRISRMRDEVLSRCDVLAYQIFMARSRPSLRGRSSICSNRGGAIRRRLRRSYLGV